jgi:hypothetical protein
LHNRANFVAQTLEKGIHIMSMSPSYEDWEHHILCAARDEYNLNYLTNDIFLKDGPKTPAVQNTDIWIKQDSVNPQHPYCWKHLGISLGIMFYKDNGKRSGNTKACITISLLPKDSRENKYTWAALADESGIDEKNKVYVYNMQTPCEQALKTQFRSRFTVSLSDGRSAYFDKNKLRWNYGIELDLPIVKEQQPALSKALAVLLKEVIDCITPHVNAIRQVTQPVPATPTPVKSPTVTLQVPFTIIKDGLTITVSTPTIIDGV